jgi:DNA-binding GntR family transcriptional regulator
MASTATAAQLLELESLQQQLEKSTNDRVKFFQLNEAFSIRLRQIADNKWRDQRNTAAA